MPASLISITLVAPNPADPPATFNPVAATWAANLTPWTTQANALATQANTDATNAAASAAAALASQSAAAASAAIIGSLSGVNAWVSGTTYSAGNLVYSPANYQTYRRKTGGAGATDPSLDGTNWAAVTQVLTFTDVIGTSATAISWQQLALTNVAATTVTLPATAVPGDQIVVIPCNGLTTNVIARNGHNIMGLAENMTIDVLRVPITLVYVNVTHGWRLI